MSVGFSFRRLLLSLVFNSGGPMSEYAVCRCLSWNSCRCNHEPRHQHCSVFGSNPEASCVLKRTACISTTQRLLGLASFWQRFLCNSIRGQSVPKHGFRAWRFCFRFLCLAFPWVTSRRLQMMTWVHVMIDFVVCHRECSWGSGPSRWLIRHLPFQTTAKHFAGIVWTPKPQVFDGF